jgi:uncharacterized protein
MDHSLTNLPLSKKQELEAITEVVRQYSTVNMLILFGSYARGDWVEEYAEDGIHIKYQSDFDLLLVVETRSTSEQANLEQKIKKSIKELPVYYTPVSILVHDIEFINRRLSKSQYFFLDIKKEGIFLFDSGKFALAVPKELSYQERYRLAKEDFKYWFNNAKEFLIDFKNAFERGSYNNAAFLLHQTAEKLYSCILLVFTRYKPNTHKLEELRSFVNALDQIFIRVFSLSTPEENRLFTLLCKAYVDARYNKNYTITQDELRWLDERVQELNHLTEKLCQEKINSFLEAATAESGNKSNIEEKDK